LNAIPVQIDAFYRTGASAVAISILSFAAAAAAIAWIVLSLTGSRAAAVAGAAVFALNPNVLYLQATPMTEPLLLALTALGVAMLIAWVNTEAGPGRTIAAAAAVGVVLALACLTRYEAWPVTYAALAATAWALWRRGEPLVRACRRVAEIALYPTAAIIAFAVFSRVVVGRWFVSSDFFVPENKALGLPFVAAAEIVWGTTQLSGQILVALAVAGGTALLVAGGFMRRRADWLIAVSLCGTAVVPWTAFLDGHPFRIRYMVPLIAFEAVAAGALAGVAATIARRKRYADVAAAVLLVAAAASSLNPLDAKAPMVVEAQWDRPNAPVRQLVTNCLRARYDGTSIMASMGSLGHYMQETSHDGFNLRDFLHEGNGDIWLAALEEPRPYAGWLLIEEKAEGGDMLARKAREHPHFLDGYSRVCEGAGLVLYERQNPMLNVKR
jgi:4-amino-4-deoxy-L-arabinose transferase-like glycosyltransferase